MRLRHSDSSSLDLMFFVPDDPPAIQQFVNDLDGFAELQRDLVLLFRLVGLGGDVQFSCRDT